MDRLKQAKVDAEEKLKRDAVDAEAAAKELDKRKAFASKMRRRGSRAKEQDFDEGGKFESIVGDTEDGLDDANGPSEISDEEYAFLSHDR